KNDLLRVASHLAISEDLMRKGVISTATANQAKDSNTRTNIVVSQANIGYGFSAISAVAPGSLVSISTSGNVQPMGFQMLYATPSSTSTLPYEVAGLSVTVAGVAVPVVYVSPWAVKFYMPADIQTGTVDVVVSSQDGYVGLGLVSVEKNASRIMTMSDDEN